MNTKRDTTSPTNPMSERFRARSGVFLLVLTLLPGVQLYRALGASSDVDLTFDPGAAVNDYVNAIIPQPDNRVFIAGQFNIIHDAARSYAAWLKADGSPDTTNAPAIYDDGHGNYTPGVYAAVAQPDGKLLLGGSFAVTNQTRNLVRLNADGSLDSSFAPGAFTNTTDIVDCLALQTDGKVIVGDRNMVLRLNPNGSLDVLLATVSSSGVVRRLVLQPDGALLVGGDFTSINGQARTNLARLNTNGLVDASFSAPAANVAMYALALVDGGKMVIGRAVDIVRLNPDGSLDSSFTGYSPGWQALSFAVQGDGKILCGGRYCTTVPRLNPNGTLDSTFQATLQNIEWGSAIVHSLAVQADGKVLVGGFFTMVDGVSRQAIARLNADGSLDSGFENGPAGIAGDVRCLTRQGDGKLLIGGWFTRINGSSRNRIARLNADGTLDSSFLAGYSGANSEVECIALQTDGALVIGGQFSSVNGSSRGRIARLYSNGMLDSGFVNNQTGFNGEVTSIALQADGKVLIAGNFSRFNYATVNSLARLNSDGSLGTFAGRITQMGSGMPHLLVQPDGKILVAGAFTAVNYTARTNLARLYADGSLDTAFANGTWPPGLGAIADVALQSDGKIVVGGYYPGGGANSYVARFNSDGSLDPSFGISTSVPVSAIAAVALQSDGKVLVGCWPGGLLSSVPRTNLFRLNANGTLDLSFTCTQGLYSSDGIGALLRQPDGKCLIAGNFSTINQSVRPFLARIMGENASLEILTPPQDQTAEAGTSVDFDVLAAGTPPLTYIWLFNGTNVVGSGPQSGLSLASLQPNQSGAYTVAVTNLSGAVTSAPAMLSVIPPVARTTATGIKLMGDAGSTLNLKYANALIPPVNWRPLSTVVLTNPPGFYFDPAIANAGQRFYRAWQTPPASVVPSLGMETVPALSLTGVVGSKVRVDAINQFGPTDAWFTLNTVTMTNTSQLYFDASAPGQPQRLYRLVPVP